MSDVISDYLYNGTVVSLRRTDLLAPRVSHRLVPAQNRMPDQHRCYGNGIPDKRRKPKQEAKAMPSPVTVAVHLQAQSYPPIPSCKQAAAEPFLPAGWTTSDGRPVLFYGMNYPSPTTSVVVR